MSEHLNDEAIEALASGRKDAAREGAYEHARACVLCAEQVERAKASSLALQAAFRQSLPPIDLNALVKRAMTRHVARPSRRELAWGWTVGVAALAVCSALALPQAISTLLDVKPVLEGGYTLARAVETAVSHGVPGGWTMLSVASLVALMMTAVLVRGLGPALARITSMALAIGMIVLTASSACAQDFQGDWTASTKVSVRANNEPRSAVLQRVARAAHLGLIVTLPDDPRVILNVRNAELKDVLVGVIADSRVVVERKDAMLFIRLPQVAAPPPPVAATRDVAEDDEPDQAAETENEDGEPSPATRSVASPTTGGKVSDRVLFGGNAVIGEGERVQDLVTFGGNVKILGEVMGDVVTMGGNVKIAKTAVVHGDLSTLGGNVTIEPGATFEGQRVSFGRALDQLDLCFGDKCEQDGSADGGAEEEGEDDDEDRHHGTFRFHGSDHDDDEDEEDSPLDRVLDFGGHLARYALLFVLGLILLSVWPDRIAAMRQAIASMPVRSAGYGALGLLAAGVLIIVLCITIIGLPVAFVASLVVFMALLAGSVAVASVLGAALPIAWLREKPVAQLALGVGILFMVSLVPVAKVFAMIVILCVAFGAVVKTRFRSNT